MNEDLSKDDDNKKLINTRHGVESTKCDGLGENFAFLLLSINKLNK